MTNRQDLELIPFKEYIHYSIDSERYLLSCILFMNGNDSYESVARMIENKDFFYNQDNAYLWQCIVEMYDKGFSLDLTTITDYVYKSGKNKMYGSENIKYELAALSRITVNHATLQYHAAVLRKMYFSREIEKIHYSGTDDPFEKQYQLNDLFQKMQKVSSSEMWLPLREVAKQLVDHIELAISNKQVFVSTTFKKLDQLNGGFRPGDLVIVAARPSVGKSAFMARMVQINANTGIPCAVISLEMKGYRLFSRMVSHQTNIEHWKIDRGKFRDGNSLDNVVSQIAKMAETMPIHISDNPNLNLTDITFQAKRLKNNGQLGILLIDYLQLIEADEKFNRNREQEVAKLSRGLKVLAMDLDVPIILLAQLNRNAEARADKKPALSDLRESGSIEQDADVVMLLHRDFKSGITEKDGRSTEREADLIIAKWRDGQTTSLKIGFDGDHMRFFDPEELQSIF